MCLLWQEWRKACKVYPVPLTCSCLYTVWRIHVTKWWGTRSLLLFLAPHKVGFSIEYLYSYQMQFVQIKHRVCGKSRSFWYCKRYSAIMSISRAHSSFFFFLLSVRATGTIYMNSDINILRMFSRIRPDCKLVHTPPERVWFSAYLALYLNKFHQI